MHNTFRKKERLCSQKAIDELMAQETKFFSHPFMVRWHKLPQNAETPAKLLIIVPKRRLRHAVDRNRTKRLIRECYRKQKYKLYTLLNEQNTSINLSLSYADNNCPDYHTLWDKTEKTLDRLISEIEKSLTETKP